PAALDRLVAALSGSDGLAGAVPPSAGAAYAASGVAPTHAAPGLVSSRKSAASDPVSGESAGDRGPLLASLRSLGRKQAFAVLALGLTPIAFAVGHFFRLPVPVEAAPNLILAAAILVSLVLLWIGNRGAAALVCACVGMPLTLKPLLVPMEGF